MLFSLVRHQPCGACSPRRAQELKGELEAARAQLLPKKKFAFNKKVTRVKGADVGGAAQGAADPNTTAAGGSGGGAAADSSGPSAQDTQLVASGHGLANLQGEVRCRPGSGLSPRAQAVVPEAAPLGAENSS